MKPISCQEMGELLCDYVSGELAPEQAQQVEQHARACPPCAIFLETYRFAARVGQMLRGDEMPTEVYARIETAVFRCIRIELNPPRPNDDG